MSEDINWKVIIDGIKHKRGIFSRSKFSFLSLTLASKKISKDQKFEFSEFLT